MISKIQNHHREKSAYIYLRQSTMGQVRHHQESTERQYALKEKAVELGWTPGMIRVIDSDLGISGTQMGNREGFKTLVAEVSETGWSSVCSGSIRRYSQDSDFSVVLGDLLLSIPHRKVHP